MATAHHPRESTGPELADALLSRIRKAVASNGLKGGVLPWLEQLEYDLHHMTPARWNELGQMELGEESQRSVLNMNVRNIFVMLEEPVPSVPALLLLVANSLSLLKNQVPSYHHVTCENTLEELVQALEKGPIVEILLTRCALYFPLVRLQRQLETIGQVGWGEMRYIKSDRSHQPFAKLIAGNVKKIVEIYEGNEQGDEKDNLEYLVKRTKELVAEGREAVRLNKSQASLSHRKSRIYRLDAAQW